MQLGLSVSSYLSLNLVVRNEGSVARKLRFYAVISFYMLVTSPQMRRNTLGWIF
jgi:hypothetical protein